MSDLLNNDQMQAPGVPTLTLTPTMSDAAAPAPAPALVATPEEKGGFGSLCDKGLA